MKRCSQHRFNSLILQGFVCHFEKSSPALTFSFHLITIRVQVDIIYLCHRHFLHNVLCIFIFLRLKWLLAHCLTELLKNMVSLEKKRLPVMVHLDLIVDLPDEKTEGGMHELKQIQHLHWVFTRTFLQPLIHITTWLLLHLRTISQSAAFSSHP